MKIIAGSFLLLVSLSIILITVLFFAEDVVDVSAKNFDSYVYIIKADAYNFYGDENIEKMRIEKRSTNEKVVIDLKSTANYENLKTYIKSAWREIPGDNEKIYIPPINCSKIALEFNKEGDFETLFCPVI